MVVTSADVFPAGVEVASCGTGAPLEMTSVIAFMARSASLAFSTVAAAVTSAIACPSPRRVASPPTTTSVGATANASRPPSLVSTSTSNRNVPVQFDGKVNVRSAGGTPVNRQPSDTVGAPALNVVPAGKPRSTTSSMAPPAPTTSKGR